MFTPGRISGQMDRRALGQRLLASLVPKLQSYRFQGSQPRPMGALSPGRPLPGLSQGLMPPSPAPKLGRGPGAGRAPTPPGTVLAGGRRLPAPPGSVPTMPPPPPAPGFDPQQAANYHAQPDSRGRPFDPGSVPDFIRWLMAMAGRGEVGGVESGGRDAIGGAADTGGRDTAFA